MSGIWIGYEQRWWDANQKNASGTASWPHLFDYNMTSSYLRNIKVRKPIPWYAAGRPVVSSFGLSGVLDRVINLYGNDLTMENTFIEGNTVCWGRVPFQHVSPGQHSDLPLLTGFQ